MSNIHFVCQISYLQFNVSFGFPYSNTNTAQRENNHQAIDKIQIKEINILTKS